MKPPQFQMCYLITQLPRAFRSCSCPVTAKGEANTYVHLRPKKASQYSRTNAGPCSRQCVALVVAGHKQSTVTCCTKVGRRSLNKQSFVDCCTSARACCGVCSFRAIWMGKHLCDVKTWASSQLTLPVLEHLSYPGSAANSEIL